MAFPRYVITSSPILTLALLPTVLTVLPRWTLQGAMFPSPSGLAIALPRERFTGCIMHTLTAMFTIWSIPIIWACWIKKCVGIKIQSKNHTQKLTALKTFAPDGKIYVRCLQTYFGYMLDLQNFLHIGIYWVPHIFHEYMGLRTQQYNDCHS